MKTMEVDVAVIGAGTGGLGARRTAEKDGATTVMIESGPYGTTCARVGCMPSKLLIAAADAAHHVREAGQFGVRAELVAVDGPAVLDRVQRERDRFVGFVKRAVEDIDESKRLRGRATFLDAHTIQVDDHTLVKAKAVVIATGSTPWLPPPLRGLGDRVITNEHVFELADLPKSVAVVGVGVIGLELGQALHRLGVDVELFGHNEQIGPVTDPVILESIRATFGAEMTVRLSSPVTAAEAVDGGVKLSWDGGERVFEYVLAATGRRPNLDLGAVELLMDTTQRNPTPIYNQRTMQVGDTNLFLAGDVTVDRALLHEASDEGKIAGTNAARYAAGKPVRAHVRRTALGVVFTHPQIATVGQTWRELQGRDFATGTIDYSDQGRSRVMGVNQGRVNIYGCPRGRLLGAEMFGPAVEHTAHLLAWAIQAGLSVADALRMPFYHPVVEEGIRTALRDLASKLKLADRAEVQCIDCGPGA